MRGSWDTLTSDQLALDHRGHGQEEAAPIDPGVHSGDHVEGRSSPCRGAEPGSSQADRAARRHGGSSEAKPCRAARVRAARNTSPLGQVASEAERAERVRAHHLLGLLARAPDLTPQHERQCELDTDDRPLLRAPARVQHHAQDAVDAEPGMPEAGVGVFPFAFGPRGSMVSGGKLATRIIPCPPRRSPAPR